MNLALVVDDKKIRDKVCKDRWRKSPEGKEYYKKWKAANRDHVNEQCRLWNKNNAEKISVQKKEYRSRPEIKEYRADYQRKYLAEIPLLSKMKRMLGIARRNAARDGKDFSITMDDVVWNEVCPVLGIKLNYGKPSNGRLSYDTPSLDRTDSSKGYIPGNVVVMSWRANMLKADATHEEAIKLANYFNSL